MAADTETSVRVALKKPWAQMSRAERDALLDAVIARLYPDAADSSGSSSGSSSSRS